MEVSLETLNAYAQSFVGDLPQKPGSGAYVVGLKGDLGAGKTTFVQHVAKILGVTETVTSPTFVIAQSYKTTHPVFRRLVHVDAYRLHDEEKDTVGFSEYVSDPHALLLVEWPEYVPGTFPETALVLNFATIDENTRTIVHA